MEAKRSAEGTAASKLAKTGHSPMGVMGDPISYPISSSSGSVWKGQLPSGSPPGKSTSVFCQSFKQWCRCPVLFTVLLPEVTDGVVNFL